MAKFLVPLTIFLLASHVHRLTSLSSVAGNQVRINHLTRLQQQISVPKSEPSREPACELTNDQMVNDQTTHQRLEWDAELPNILSPIRGRYSLSQTISITQITSNISYTFEAVNGVNHDHDKIKVDERVTFSDERDSEILSESPVECNSRSNDSNGLKCSAERAVSR